MSESTVMTVKDLVKALAEWVAVNAEHDVYLPAVLAARIGNEYAYSVPAKQLLDFVSERTGIRKEKIGKWVEQAAVAAKEAEAVEFWARVKAKARSTQGGDNR